MCGCVFNAEIALAMYSKNAYFSTDIRQNISLIYASGTMVTEEGTQVYSTEDRPCGRIKY